MLVFIAHGSKKSEWRKPFETLTESIRTKANLTEADIDLCYMEISAPSLEDIVIKHQSTTSTFKVLPLFMSGGGHVKYDIKATIDALSKKYPSLNFELLKAIGEQPAVVDAMADIAINEL